MHIQKHDAPTNKYHRYEVIGWCWKRKIISKRQHARFQVLLYRYLCMRAATPAISVVLFYYEKSDKKVTKSDQGRNYESSQLKKAKHIYGNPQLSRIACTALQHISDTKVSDQGLHEVRSRHYRGLGYTLQYHARDVITSCLKETLIRRNRVANALLPWKSLFQTTRCGMSWHHEDGDFACSLYCCPTGLVARTRTRVVCRSMDRAFQRGGGREVTRCW